MIRNIIRIAICAITFTASMQAASQDGPTITEAELLHRTQALYDAAGAGDAKPWDAYFADDAMVYDEKGHTLDKKAMLADVSPLPKGMTVALKVVDPHIVMSPGVAIVAYACDEKEMLFGQTLQARYHTVDTWLHRQGKWQIAASQTMRYYEDPALGRTDVSRLNDLIGTYELTPDNLREITRQGNALFLQRGSGAKIALLPESGDVFFRKGVEGRIVFRRNASGNVDAFNDRRNNEDVVWKRVK